MSIFQETHHCQMTKMSTMESFVERTTALRTEHASWENISHLRMMCYPAPRDSTYWAGAFEFVNTCLEIHMNHLLEPVRTKLRSSQILTSLPQVISELVQNSLDAGANQIEVGVDCEEWECWVKDNGAGISKDGLLMLSKRLEAGRYSKFISESSL